MKIAAVGFTCVDVYENLGRCYATGNGVDCLLNLMRLLPLTEGSVVSAVGEDAYGELMRSTLRRFGVNDRYLRTVLGGRTAVIKMSLNGRDRVHGERIRGVMDGYDILPEELAFIQTQDVIHTDLSWNVVPHLPEMRKKGARVYFDFSVRHNHPAVKSILPHIDWGIFSFEKPGSDVEDFLRQSIQAGPRVLIASFGKEGALAYDGSQFVYQPSEPVDDHIVNTAGAGDAFGAGFLAGILQGKMLKEAMAIGAKTAAEAIQQFDPY